MLEHSHPIAIKLSLQVFELYTLLQALTKRYSFVRSLICGVYWVLHQAWRIRLLQHLPQTFQDSVLCTVKQIIQLWIKHSIGRVVTDRPCIVISIIC